MPTRKIGERNIRKLTRTGGGKCVSLTLPIEMMRILRWKDRQKVVVEKKGNKIIIQDWKGKNHQA